MTSYLMIESRDPLDTTETALSYDLAARLVKAGHPVTIFLVENGVFAARRGAKSAALARVAGAGVEVLADEFALRERGIAPGRVIEQVKPAPLEVVVDRLCAGSRTLWH